MIALMSPGAGTPGVDGRRLLVTITAGVAIAAVVGIATYYLRSLSPSANRDVTAQIIVVEVYATLVLAFVSAFGPLRREPLALRFTGGRDIGLACLAWLGILAAAIAIYTLLAPITGGLVDVARQILTVATDAARLQTQPTLAWVMAIGRGCLLVPLFEELLFRGVLLAWLQKHLPVRGAVTASAVLFAVMHAYPVAMPLAFVYGLVCGGIRVRTGSTLNTVLIHVLNNVLFLCLGVWLLR